ncbi:MAG: TlpA disulfide reductase family protein [Ignavibacteriales bacterium]|nr:TlpA disulfide reductase family protein [Ignavibacteriales bacterium]
MKTRMMLGILFVMSLTATFVVAQDQAATMSPAKPKIGDEIVVTYNPSVKSATLKGVKELTAEVMLAKGSGEMPQLNELPMKSESGVWKASFKLSDEKVRVLLLRFTSGEQKDDNGEKSWATMICGANGNALEGAHLAWASMLRSGSFADFKVTKDAEGMKKELAIEKELYPANYSAVFMQWSMMLREAPGDETKAKIKGELNALYDKNSSNEDLLPLAIGMYQQIGMKEKSEEIRKAALAANPKGKVAESARLNEVRAERDAVKRVSMMEKFIAEFPPDAKNKENYNNSLISFRMTAAMSQKKYEEAAKIVESMPIQDGGMYNSLAWPLIEKGEQLELATAWAKKGVEFLKNPDPASKPSYYSAKQWKKQNESSLGMVLDTYGFGLLQLGKAKEAAAVMKEAVDLTKGEQADINQRLVECYVKDGSYDKAMAVGADFIQKGKSNDKLLEAYKTAYVKVKGSDKGFDEAIAQAKQTGKSEMKKDLAKSRVNKPAVDFALKNLEGKVVKLSDLRGKVVVVDFWATWCGPCKASFPYLQQVYNKYKDNPKIVILALNTWENVSGKEREDLVKKFMADNKYTFPVLYDEGFVEKYGVEGIPTKFVIDKKGMIQFKTIGFTGEKMVDEMITQFDMLLDDNFYSSSK